MKLLCGLMCRGPNRLKQSERKTKETANYRFTSSKTLEFFEVRQNSPKNMKNDEIRKKKPFSDQRSFPKPSSNEFVIYKP